MQVRETMQALRAAVSMGHLDEETVNDFMDGIESAILAMFHKASQPDVRTSALALDDMTSCWWQEGGS